MELYYKQPAGRWEETLPIGNGSLGGMIWGNVSQELIGLNEETLWSGYKHDKNNQNALEFLPEARKLIFEGKNAEAQRLVEEKMLAEFTESYLPLGNLKIDFSHNGNVEKYVRRLDLDHAIAEVSYDADGVRYKREYFASYPSRAMYIRLCSNANVMGIRVSLESDLQPVYESNPGMIRMNGRCPEHVDPSYVDSETPVIWGERGQAFHADLTLLSSDGTHEIVFEGEKAVLVVKDASEVILAVTAVNNPDVVSEFNNWGYEGIKEKHEKDYRNLYSRVELDLGSQPDVPTDIRLQNMKEGKEDTAMYALYFQYGRYLLISSSREGGVPANLQGIWNWEFRAPWSCNYTTNINAQMNYWLAQSCNLAECLEPYFDFVKGLSIEGQKTAETHFGCRGFTVSHNTDYWMSTNPVGVAHGNHTGQENSGCYSFFPLGGAWMCEEFWKHYEYHEDKEFLRETAYPVLKQAALFCLDWLVPFEGFYVACPSASPENVFYVPGGEGEKASLTYACTMDMTIIREVFGDFKKICAELEIEDEILEEMKEKEAKLFPYKTGKYGQLQEWPIDYEEVEPGHRHISHLYGIYPAEIFEQDNRLKEACRKTLERRLANGGGHTGWSCGWIVQVFAVLGDAAKSYEYLRTLLTRSTYPNLWDMHPPFQIDGNFAGSAAIANMLVQDRGGELKLLPALPKEWKDGCVKGIRIKGRRTIDLYWKDHTLEKYEIHMES